MARSLTVDPRLLDCVALDRELVRRRGLAEFTKRAWQVLEPATPLKWGWANDAICEHLEAVTQGDITRLLINVPPGAMKSLSTCVFWPAWEWGPKDLAHYRFVGASYSEPHATRDSRRMRDLVQSRWYQDRWPLHLTRVGEKSFENERTGWRQGVPVKRMTGERGHRVVWDDPHSTEQAESDADRATAVRIFRETLPSRLVDPITSAIVIIMQRLHTRDVSGEILVGDYGYEHLMIPMEFEPDRARTTTIGWRDPRTEEGELMQPDRWTKEVIERDKRVMGTYAAAGQLQQRPAPRGGAIVKEAWIKRFKRRGSAPRLLVQSWDTASKPAQHNDPSACGTFAVFADHVELWRVQVKRREFPQLVLAAKDQYGADWGIGRRPHSVLIEDKDSGQQLIQVLKADTKLPVIAINPGTLDKATRLEGITPELEAGNLWVPDTEALPEEDWVAHYLAELTTFPASSHKDQVDMTSQFFDWLAKRSVGYLNLETSADLSSPSRTKL